MGRSAHPEVGDRRRESPDRDFIPSLTAGRVSSSDATREAAMTWRYDQSTGDLFHDDTFIGTGYSGAGRTLAEGRNNPAMEAVRMKGPIPAGQWLVGPAGTNAQTGPVSMDLTPVGHDAHGRTAFLIHGDNSANNASEGCIIMARGIRDEIAASPDRELMVTP
jgi:hypothetical protein